MKHKKDMYINYDRTYKKHKTNGRSRFGLILFIVFAVIGLSAGVVYLLDIGQRNKANSSGENNKNDEEEVGTGKDEGTSSDDNASVTLEPVQSPTPTQATQITQSPVTSIPSGAPSHEEAGTIDNRIPTKVKGIYVTAPVAGSYLLEGLMKLTDETEINAMVIDVKDDHGKITYRMDSALAQDINATTNIISDMPGLVAALKQKGVYVIARIVAFKDPYLAEQRKDLAIKNKDGTLYRDNNKEGWVNPYNHKVWDYLVEVASKAAEVGFDEIQFDYIRFSTGKGMSEVDFGDVAKTKTKEEIINEFCQYACEQLKPLGVYVSADVYGTIISSKVDAALVGQNYVEMAKHLDYICPMIYPSHFGEGNYGIKYPDQEPYNIISKVLKASKTKLDQIPEGEHRAIVRPWLQDFTATWISHYIEYGGPELREQINAVYDTGYEEWLLWNASCVYSVDGLLAQTE